MADPVGLVDSALWRIAELGARCGQRSLGVDRRPMWEELERLIAQLDNELKAARQGEGGATPELGRLRRQLKVVAGERDSERARLAQHIADAEVARRERDRVRDQATAKAEAARAARRALQDKLEQAEAARAEAAARLDDSAAVIAGLEAAVQAAVAERDAVVLARNASLVTTDHVISHLAARAQGERLPFDGDVDHSQPAVGTGVAPAAFGDGPPATWLRPDIEADPADGIGVTSGSRRRVGGRRARRSATAAGG